MTNKVTGCLRGTKDTVVVVFLSFSIVFKKVWKILDSMYLPLRLFTFKNVRCKEYFNPSLLVNTPDGTTKKYLFRYPGHDWNWEIWSQFCHKLRIKIPKGKTNKNLKKWTNLISNNVLVFLYQDPRMDHWMITCLLSLVPSESW